MTLKFVKWEILNNRLHFGSKVGSWIWKIRNRK